jgi:alpha-glucuronidase
MGPAQGPSALAAEAELQRGFSAMTGTAPQSTQSLTDGAIWLATPASAQTPLPVLLKDLGEEGYAIAPSRCRARPSR